MSVDSSQPPMGHARLEPVAGADPASNRSDVPLSAAHAWRLAGSMWRPRSQRAPIHHRERRFGFTCITDTRKPVAEAAAIRKRMRVGNVCVGPAECLACERILDFFRHGRLSVVPD
jgi:hypothetical protein